MRNLKKIDAKKRSSSQKHSVPKTAKVAPVRHLDYGIYVDGQVNGESYIFLLNTDVSKMIVKPSVVKKLDNLRDSGELDVCLTIVNVTLKLRVLIVDIEEDVMDIMRRHGYGLDLKNGVLRINGEEVILHHQEDAAIRIIVPHNTTVPERNELNVKASPADTVPEGIVMILEPRNHDEDMY